MTSHDTTLSVIVPVRNGAGYLRRSLEALRASDYRDYEVIVVDDASTDETRSVAEQFATRLVALESQSGPAKARNRGADVARGDYLLFVDADVCVHPQTLHRVVKSFEQDRQLDAVFGSYDAAPAAPSLLSQYKNLQHHFVHHEGHGPASTFWAGCGAIKRSVFRDVGGFDTSFGRPCIEDIELGVRMAQAGYKLAINKHIQCTHLKRWTFRGILKADIFDRAVPWTQLIARQGSLPDTLNLKGSQRLCALLALVLLLSFVAAACWVPAAILLPLGWFAMLVVLDRVFSRRPLPVAVGAIGVLAGFAAAVVLASSLGGWSLLPLGCLLGLVWLNRRFYAFLSRVHHPAFAVLVMPMHILYYLYGSAVFVIVTAHAKVFAQRAEASARHRGACASSSQAGDA